MRTNPPAANVRREPSRSRSHGRWRGHGNASAPAGVRTPKLLRDAMEFERPGRAVLTQGSLRDLRGEGRSESRDTRPRRARGDRASPPSRRRDGRAPTPPGIGKISRRPVRNDDVHAFRCARRPHHAWSPRAPRWCSRSPTKTEPFLCTCRVREGFLQVGGVRVGAAEEQRRDGQWMNDAHILTPACDACGRPASRSVSSARRRRMRRTNRRGPPAV